MNLHCGYLMVLTPKLSSTRNNIIKLGSGRLDESSFSLRKSILKGKTNNMELNMVPKKAKKVLTKIKKMYYARFAFRILVFLAAIAIYIWRPQDIDIMLGFNMFKMFNVVHLFLALWIAEITMQFMPLVGKFSIGSLKHFQRCMQGVVIKDE